MRWLSIRCNRLFWLLACLSFSFCSSNAFSSVPAEEGYTGSGGFSSSALGACQLLGYNYLSPAFTQTSDSGILSGSGYVWHYKNGYSYYGCRVTEGGSNVTTVYQAQRCVTSEYSLIGSDLVCGSGPLNICPSAGTVSNTAQTSSFVGSTTPTTSCYKGADGTSNCVATCTGSSVVTYDDVAGVSNNFCTQFVYSGAACTTTDALVATSPGTGSTVTPLVSPPKSSADCPAGSGFAEINNQTMCLKSGTTYSGGSTSTTGGGGTSTQTTTTTINKDGTTTTKTTVSGTDTAGNSTGSYTTTTTGSINGADGGTNKDPTLNLGPAPNFDQSLPNDTGFNVKTVSNPVFNTSLFGTSGSCPAPLTFEALGRSFSITFQPVCDLADIIRGIILMLAAIVALRAVVTK